MNTGCAPAKLNLYLHVLGKRADGYHLLDSLVVFTALGDTVAFDPDAPAPLTLITEGAFAEALGDVPPHSNLAWRAISAVAQACGRAPRGLIRLTKRLPLAAGLGGGSADAAAALRLAAECWGLPKDAWPALALNLGHDVPCCLGSETCFFGNTGDVLDPAPVLPRTFVVLINPRTAVPTPAVFQRRQGAFSLQGRFDHAPATVAELAALLALRNNDLTQAACEVAPVIGDVLSALRQTPECLLARMAGSGATCFGMFESADKASNAAQTLRDAHPMWWVEETFF